MAFMLASTSCLVGYERTRAVTRPCWLPYLVSERHLKDACVQNYIGPYRSPDSHSIAQNRLAYTFFSAPLCPSRPAESRHFRHPYVAGFRGRVFRAAG